jgi:hypothetical protein
MAVVQDIFGKKASGKMGTVSVYPLWDKNIVRSLPGKRRGEGTPNQLRNQLRFKQIREFCAPFKTLVIPRIWNALGTTSSGYHLFMKTNSPAFDREGVLTDPKLIRLAMGKLPLPQGMQAQRTAPEALTIVVQWEKGSPWGGLPLRDQLMVISYGEGNYSDMQSTGLVRGNLGGSFELPPLKSPATHLYLFFESLDQRYYSESVCLEI